MASGKLEAIIMHLLSVLKTGVEDYCDLETIDGNTICGNDGSLATIVLFHGTKSVLSRDHFEHMIKLMEASFSPYLGTKGHQLQIVFRRDLDASESLEANAIVQRASAAALNLDLNDLIDEGVAKYAQYVYDEDCFFVFWSRPNLLDATESNMARNETNALRKELDWPKMKDAQNILRPISYLYDRHLAYVSTICADLESPGFGCSIEQINVSSMLRTVRRSVFPDYTSSSWTPIIPGTKLPPRWKANDDHEDQSEFGYPALPRQIMVATAEIGARSNLALPDPTTVRLGSRVYAPLLIEIPPRDPQTFNKLFNALNSAETVENGQSRAVPYSISFMLESDGMGIMGFKTLLSGVLSFTSEVNRNINLANKALNEQKRDGECIVKLRIAAMTWASNDSDSIKELARRKSKLWRILEGWGKPVVIERTGNPMVAFQSNAVGLTWKHIGNPAPAPLGEALSIMPLTRPASPFSTGSIIYRSLDGKILLYQRFSSQQAAWLTLVAGGQGSGKSVLMNNNNVESCLMPGLTRLPYVCVIDFGISSKGFTDLIRDNLPDHLKHLVIYKRLQNDVTDAINPMDTPLGKRVPLAKDRTFLVNFYSMLATPPERMGKAYDGMASFVGRVVDGVFLSKSDRHEKAEPNRYRPGFSSVVDDAVRKIEYPVKAATTYWELVDAFFQAGLIYEAEYAQRYAMPILTDMIKFASTPEIEKEYAGHKVESGPSINEAFRQGLREAINDYPIFKSHTSFDIGSARIMALDLQDVAPEGSDAAVKQAALMYMIARQSFMKKIAFSVEDLPSIDTLYKSHYVDLIKDLEDDYKVLCMDEYKRTGNQPNLQMQVGSDVRQGRKWQLEVVLASQMMEDFGELTKLATSYFILSAGTPATRGWMAKNIGLSAVDEQALVSYVHGANIHGTTFLARFATSKSAYTQLFTLTIGPMRLWALSTTQEDRSLRSLLYAALPGNEARALLAKRFPGGSCKKAVEVMKAEASKSAEFIDDDFTDSVIERIAKEMLADYSGSSQLAA